MRVTRVTGALFASVVGVLSAGLVPAAAQEDCGAAINYEDADIRAVVDEIAMRTGRKFVLDPRVQGRVTVKSGPNGGLCSDEAWELFQAMLRVNGFTATPINGGSYKIVPVQEGPRAAGPVGEGRPGDLITQIIRLRHIDAREAAANLAQIINERGVVAPVRSGNALIMVDTADNIERLRAVLAQIDRDSTVYRTIPLNNASSTEVARVLRGLAQEISEEGGQNQRISVVPVEASNSVLIRAEPSVISRLVGVVGELDRIGGAKADLSVIYLNHADAEEMAGLLRELAAAQPPAAGNGENAPQGRQRATISFHKPTNSVIISGDADIQRTLQSVVAQLDIRQAQVMIEAIIVEISDSTARELGVEYFISGDSTNSSVPFTSVNFLSRPAKHSGAGWRPTSQQKSNNARYGPKRQCLPARRLRHELRHVRLSNFGNQRIVGDKRRRHWRRRNGWRQYIRRYSNRDQTRHGFKRALDTVYNSFGQSNGEPVCWPGNPHHHWRANRG